MASIMSLDCTAKERASSSTPKLGSRLKISCRRQSSTHMLFEAGPISLAACLEYILAQVCLCAGLRCQVITTGAN